MSSSFIITDDAARFIKAEVKKLGVYTLDAVEAVIHITIIVLLLPLMMKGPQSKCVNTKP